MTTIESHLETYFSSLSSITKKIWQDKDTLRKGIGESKWDALTFEEQEEVLENYLVDPSIREKYSDIESEDFPEVFPKLDVRCGEKIVVDFENDDGWTWTDEHSGPFSWMTRSQQDLTLDDLDSVDEASTIKKPTCKPRTKSRSPDRADGTKKSWESTYSDNKGKKANTEAAHTADEIFQKFGITFSFGSENDGSKDEEQSSVIGDCRRSYTSPVEESKLLPGQYQNENFELGDDEGKEFSSSYYNMALRDDNLSESYNSSEVGSLDKKESFSKKKKDKSNQRKQHQVGKVETEMISLIDTSQEESYYEKLDPSTRYSGEISPVYIEDPGESSTDPRLSTSQFTYPESVVHADSPSVLGSDSISLQDSVFLSRDTSVICEQPTSQSDSFDMMKVSDSPESSVDDADSDTMKSGFAFLDNW